MARRLFASPAERIIHVSNGAFVASARRHFAEHPTLADVVKEYLPVSLRPLPGRDWRRKRSEWRLTNEDKYQAGDCQHGKRRAHNDREPVWRLWLIWGL
jgi:hypothetical protein